MLQYYLPEKENLSEVNLNFENHSMKLNNQNKWL